jgi:hypothetical protein
MPPTAGPPLFPLYFLTLALLFIMSVMMFRFFEVAEFLRGVVGESGHISSLLLDPPFGMTLGL